MRKSCESIKNYAIRLIIPENDLENAAKKFAIVCIELGLILCPKIFSLCCKSGRGLIVYGGVN